MRCPFRVLPPQTENAGAGTGFAPVPASDLDQVVLSGLSFFEGINDLIDSRFAFDLAVPPVLRVDNHCRAPVADLETSRAGYDDIREAPVRQLPLHVLQQLHGILLVADALGLSRCPEAAADENMMFRFFHVSIFLSKCISTASRTASAALESDPALACLAQKDLGDGLAQERGLDPLFCQSLHDDDAQAGPFQNELGKGPDAADQDGIAVMQKLGHGLPSFVAAAGGRRGPACRKGCLAVFHLVDPHARRLAEMLVDKDPLLAGDGHIGSLRALLRLGRLPEEIHNFFAVRLADHACRIGPAPAAVSHLGDEGPGSPADRRDGFGCGRRDVGEGCPCHVVHGDGVEDIRPQRRHVPGNLFDMSVVDAGDDDRVDLDGHAFLLEQSDGLYLAFEDDAGGVFAPVYPAVLPGPGVDFLSHGGIDGVDRTKKNTLHSLLEFKYRRLLSVLRTKFLS